MAESTYKANEDTLRKTNAEKKNYMFNSVVKLKRIESLENSCRREFIESVAEKKDKSVVKLVEKECFQKNHIIEKEPEEEEIKHGGDEDEDDDEDNLTWENKILEEEAEREEKRRKSEIAENYNEESVEKNTKQLLYLLSRTQFYSKYLSDKIATSVSSSHKNVSDSTDKSTEDEHRNVPLVKSSKRKIDSLEDSKILSDEVNTNPSEKKHKKRKIDEPFDEKMINECMQTIKEGKYQDVRKSSFVSFQQSEYFVGSLRDYQEQGVEWLKCLYENGVNGILADEMGLGKTVQAIALICHLISKRSSGPFLIIVPLSTVSNWLMEFERFAPDVPTLLFHGDALTRNKLVKSFKKVSLPNGFCVYPVVITTYEVPLREQHFLYAYRWKYIIVDEGHRLKNYRCQLGVVLRNTKSDNRLLLTGTPLQNNLEELWSLLNFLLPEVFNDLALFESWLCTDQFRESEFIIEQEAQNKVVSTIHKILSPFILRRMKCDVILNLPPKKEVIVYAPMTELQWDLYTATIDRSISKLLGMEKDIVVPKEKRHCTLNKNYNIESIHEDKNPEKELAGSNVDHTSDTTPFEKQLLKDCEGNDCRVYLTMQVPALQLRKIANHPYLAQMPLDPKNPKCLLIDENIIKKSGKMLVLDELLSRLKARGHKVLIFSTLVMLLDLIEELLVLRRYEYVRLDGSVALDDRTQNIKQFMKETETFAFLISTRAGGLGLNLTAADTVIIFDSDWNPQVDLQAQDRCHRIGQTKPVVVYRLVTKGTVDERILAVAEKKKKLGKLILHKKLFKNKSQKKMDEAISLTELKELLENEDYSKVVHTSGNVLTEEQLDDILDRRECTFTQQ